jgi:hypothetical protein
MKSGLSKEPASDVCSMFVRMPIDSNDNNTPENIPLDIFPFSFSQSEIDDSIN